MTHYGTCAQGLHRHARRSSMIAAAIGSDFVWAFEVDGFWQTIGVLFVVASVSVFIATIPIALAQAMRAIADVGDTVSAQGRAGMSELPLSSRSTRTLRRSSGSRRSSSATRATTRPSAGRRPRQRWRSSRSCTKSARRSRSSSPRGLGALTGELLLERVHDPHPHAKRALLIPWGGWADEETADAIRNAMALGYIDYYAIKPFSSPDEIFHRLVSEFLQEWRRQERTGPQGADDRRRPVAPRRRPVPPLAQRCSARVPHAGLTGGDRVPRVVQPGGRRGARGRARGRLAAGRSRATRRAARDAYADRPRPMEFDVVIVGAGLRGLRRPCTRRPRAWTRWWSSRRTSRARRPGARGSGTTSAFTWRERCRVDAARLPAGGCSARRSS